MIPRLFRLPMKSSPTPSGLSLAKALGLLSLFLCSPVHAKPGDVDKSFGEDGVVIMDPGGKGSGFQTTAVQKDGKIIVGGHSFFLINGTQELLPLLVRLTRDGRPDPSFGKGGTVLNLSGRKGAIQSLRIDKKGRILCLVNAPDIGQEHPVYLSRHLEDGSLDPSFGGGDGIAEADQAIRGAAKVCIQEDGRIVVIGSRRVSDESGFHFETLITCFRADGSRDPSFGKGGLVQGTRSVSHPPSGDLLADGRIVTGGEYYDETPSPEEFFDPTGIRFNCYKADGGVDTSFGEKNGEARIRLHPVEGYAQDIAALPRGGFSFTGLLMDNRGGDSRYGYLTGKATRTGVLETDFSAPSPVKGWFRSGLVATFAQGKKYAQPNLLAVDERGRVLVAGFEALSPFRKPTRAVLMRHTAAGELDKTFGTGGKIDNLFTGGVRVPSAIAIQPDGAIVVTGAVTPGDMLGDPTSATITRVEGGGPQPDVRMGLAQKASHGNNIYPDGDAQTLHLTLHPGDPARDVFITIQNDGSETDSFSLYATGSDRGYQITWYHGEEDVTRQFTRQFNAEKLETGPLAPGKIYQLRASLRANANATGTTRSFFVRATSLTTPSLRDRVVILAKVK